MDNSKRSVSRRVLGISAALLVGAAAIGFGVASGVQGADTFTGCLKQGTLTNVAIGNAPKHPCTGSAVKVSWSQDGPRGPRGLDGLPGSPGAQGSPGPQGSPGASDVELATWTYHYNGDGTLDGGLTQIPSTSSLEDGDVIEFVSVSVTGDFTSCTAPHGPAVEIRIYGHNMDLIDSPEGVQPTEEFGELARTPGDNVVDAHMNPLAAHLRQSGEGHLYLFGRCRISAGGESLTEIAVPPFTVKVVFRWTHWIPPSEVTFN